MAEITIRPTAKQHEAYEALKTKDRVFLGGGAGGGKSWLICESRLINAIRFPGYKSFIGREELKRLMQSTYITWTKVCNYHQIPQTYWKLNGQYNYIELNNGSRIDLLDLKFLPSDPLYERLGSLEYTDGAIEEAGEVYFLAYDVLQSRIGRHLNKEYNINPTLLCTGNPKKNWTYKEFYKPWKNKTLPGNYAFIQSLYQDNPHTATEYGHQLSQIKDKATKERLMYGNWEYEDDPTALIEYDAIIDLFTNTIEKSEAVFATVDVARYGQDKTIVMIWKGFEVVEIIVWEKQGLDITAEKLRDILRKRQIPYSCVVIDEVGVGGGVVDILRGTKGFIANSSPIENVTVSRNINPKSIADEERGVRKWENYRSLKDQCAYMLSDMINDRKIAIKCEDKKIEEMIIEELEQIKRHKADEDSKLMIRPKDEVKELIGRSPDLSDCLLMRIYLVLRRVNGVYNENSNIFGKKKTFK